MSLAAVVIAALRVSTVLVKGTGYTFRGYNSVTVVCLPSEKFTRKENDLLPLGSSVFPIRVDLLSDVA